MMMEVDFPNDNVIVRYAIVIVDTDVVSGQVNSRDLRFYDEYCEAELWIRKYGGQYGVDLSYKISRFFRIERRYYPKPRYKNNEK